MARLPRRGLVFYGMSHDGVPVRGGLQEQASGGRRAHREGVQEMPKVCEVCGKRPARGNTVSFSHRRGRRTWKPNLQSVRAVVGGQNKRINACVSCLKAGKVTKRPVG
jgi:large subunit ribosomal protein L28